LLSLVFTHVLKIWFLIHVGSYVGVAPRAKVLLGKTEAIDYEEPIEEDYFVSALEWGEERGADMVSSSLGYHR